MLLVGWQERHPACKKTCATYRKVLFQNGWTKKTEGSQLTQAHLKNSRYNRGDGAGSDVSIVIIIVVEYLCVLGRE